MNTEIKNTTAQNILKGLGIEIKGEFQNLQYSQLVENLLDELQNYLELQGLVLAYEDDFEDNEENGRVIFPFTTEFRRHLQKGMGIDQYACEEERRSILAMAQGGQA